MLEIELSVNVNECNIFLVQAKARRSRQDVSSRTASETNCIGALFDLNLDKFDRKRTFFIRNQFIINFVLGNLEFQKL